jgi:hypothetical protein
MLRATSPAAAAADVLLAALLLLLLLQQPCASSSAVALAVAAAGPRPLLHLAVLPQLLWVQLWQQVVFLMKARVVAGHLCEPRHDCTAMWLLAAALLAQTNTLDACTAAPNTR